VQGLIGHCYLQQALEKNNSDRSFWLQYVWFCQYSTYVIKYWWWTGQLANYILLDGSFLMLLYMMSCIQSCIPVKKGYSKENVCGFVDISCRATFPEWQFLQGFFLKDTEMFPETFSHGMVYNSAISIVWTY
jgi:hypothetical protein